MSDDLDRALEPGQRSFWRGTAKGGPIDGSEISVESAPRIPMRALHVVLNVGDDVEAADWHLYVFGQRYSETKGIEGIFTHLGTMDEGYPIDPRD